MGRKYNTAMKITPTLLASFLLHATPAVAQQGGSQRENSLERQLAESEARVQMLQQRIERLEGRFEALTSQPPRPAPQGPANAAAPQQPRPAPAAAAPAPTRTAAAPRPGTFEVDEDAAQRALERTLTQQGALLLPQGAIDITPGFNYTRNEIDTPTFVDVVDPATGAARTVLDRQRLRRNEFTARVDIRAGLPMESQLELGLPFNYVRSSRVGSFNDESSANGNGMGDITVGLAKTLLRERGAVPDLIGRVAYNFGNGSRSDNRVVLPGGYRQLSAELVALKRQDPLAFFGAVSYTHSFEEGGIKPGGQTNLGIGTVLAASPATSLQFGFTQTYKKDQELNGTELRGSSLTYGTVNIGASSVLSRDVMLLISTGIGVGSDAPKYSFNVSVPISFR